MSGRRQGLRKSARKGTGSSTENVAAYDSTFDSEAELCPAQNSGIEQMLHHATSENEQDKCLDTDNEREVSNSQKHAVETAENVANETRRHDFLCGTLNNLCDSETAESDQEVRGKLPMNTSDRYTPTQQLEADGSNQKEKTLITGQVTHKFKQQSQS